jgi:hypothetical protein
VLATIFVALRIHNRLFVTLSPVWDDAIIVFAAILNLITVALNTIAISHGIGRHIYYLSNDDIVNTLYYRAILRPLGIIAYCLPKLAVVILVIQLMVTQRRGIWFLYSIIAVLFVTPGLSIVLLFAQCDPPDHFWHPLSPAHCIPNHVLDAVSYVGGCEYLPERDEFLSHGDLESEIHLIFCSVVGIHGFHLGDFPHHLVLEPADEGRRKFPRCS